ncbi:small ribosomal subunit protein uS9m [Humulus lupulus]|uniref:small ribosomal subunit protein uS9m n=1 Tax=Humulus lupulus TaxID=3486 RepID=UPI002B401F52|nr:small ribosomal subunit protein uS9m [Humulus lupulus]
MLSRLLPKPFHVRSLTLISSKVVSHLQRQIPSPSKTPTFIFTPRLFSSSNRNNNGGDQSETNIWKLSQESEGKFESLFHDKSANAGRTVGTEPGEADSLLKVGDGGDEWETAGGYKPWSLEEEEKGDLFDIGEDVRSVSETETEVSTERDRDEEMQMLQQEKHQLSVILKGPNRAFGDLIAASGITDDMLDSLIALKNLEGVEGLPPLSELENLRYEKSTRKSSRAEIERQKQEEAAKARVRQVDDKGRSYGTGRRKCSVARVWIQPGDGKFLVNEKEFDVYFPMLDHRAALLRPFSETKTLGLWDVTSTVKGGGTTGQVGAVLLGISRALQNWEPDLRPPLRDAGFLTRDPRMVERKKPGKAKARKSHQWVKR